LGFVVLAALLKLGRSSPEFWYPAGGPCNPTSPSYHFVPQNRRPAAARLQVAVLVEKEKKKITIMDTTPPFAGLALSLTVPKWETIGIEATTSPTEDLDVLVDRAASVLLVRVVAQTCYDEYIQRRVVRKGKKGVPQSQTSSSLGTASICRTALMRQEPWPEPITETLIQQVRNFCKSVLMKYNDVPYHSAQHAVQVTLSVNKLIDMMCSGHDLDDNPAATRGSTKMPSSFGLRNDPLALTAMLFAAIIHDVEHQGVPNRQLAGEGTIR